MELFELTVYELQEKIKKREISSEEIVKSIYKRINEVENTIKSFITLADEKNILENAKKIDAKNEYNGLAGIPYALKDIFCTSDFRTTCSSKMLENFVPTYNASATVKLREQDAILMGKLNMDEFAMGSSTERSAFHLTCNPWDLERVPGGSSGGSAAAVAAGEIPFALGTDTGGSLRQPAAFCGVVGLKPTYGRVSRWGVIAFASSLDQAGPITKDVRDTAIIMNEIAGYDSLDSNSLDVEVPDYTQFLNQDIKGLKIGYPKEYFQEYVTQEVKDAVINALKKYEELGAVVEEVSLPYTEYALPAYYLIAPAEASANLARFDGVRFGYRDTNAENVLDMFKQSRSAAFNNEVKRRILFGTNSLRSNNYEDYYLKAQKVRRLVRDDFTRVFKDYDVIVAPTTPTTAFKIGEQINHPIILYLNDIITVPVNLAGLPGMSIPCGFSDGLPIGMQLIGKPFDEGTLIKAGHAFEQSTDYHKAKPAVGVK
ncbi:Aspartyl-tRNA(Asn) amidotransferase subunit A [Candidatus Syntrophocurvum alkaliphilum]|uniref:Glutamyl-tRNA(Gln) amidotransferase subunit A n=1 Tax=Candidatus Syntrophocurvum alkaliphilum TaxID=2293317 RepID=A0A6I6DGR3_9FIRM|nr:Asp-tRNA(Asn)/Glu-tRNA(Gln) amidotransferase subunit GatA [Candidatus Syntrophocurvum alkaliphilum]QGT98829.1 Aspartyl-tRNA(Asn) amidotransferase subunit A [Candidatus Syntrophocurvum alkaliphilum]